TVRQIPNSGALKVTGLAVDRDGSVHYAYQQNDINEKPGYAEIRKISPIAPGYGYLDDDLVAGSEDGRGYDGDGGPADVAKVSTSGLAFTPDGILVFYNDRGGQDTVPFPGATVGYRYISHDGVIRAFGASADDSSSSGGHRVPGPFKNAAVFADNRFVFSS